MKEFFIRTVSFPAPIVGDVSTSYIMGKDHCDALWNAFHEYSHPCGLFYIEVFNNADEFHKQVRPLVTYHTPKACEWLKKRELGAKKDE